MTVYVCIQNNSVTNTVEWVQIYNTHIRHKQHRRLVAINLKIMSPFLNANIWRPLYLGIHSRELPHNSHLAHNTNRYEHRKFRYDR